MFKEPGRNCTGHTSPTSMHGSHAADGREESRNAGSTTQYMRLLLVGSNQAHFPPARIYGARCRDTAIAAPTMPARLRRRAACTGVSSVSRGTHFSWSREIPPPTMKASG